MTVRFFEEDPIDFEAVQLPPEGLLPTVSVMTHGDHGYISYSDYFADKNGRLWVSKNVRLVNEDDAIRYSKNIDDFVRVICIRSGDKTGLIVDISAYLQDNGIKPDDYKEPYIDEDAEDAIPVIAFATTEMEADMIVESAKRQFKIDIGSCALLAYFREISQQADDEEVS